MRRAVPSGTVIVSSRRPSNVASGTEIGRPKPLFESTSASRPTSLFGEIPRARRQILLSVGPRNDNPSHADARALSGELIALRYPNGRVYETALDRKLTPGDEFEMYGRRWTAMRTKTSGKRTRLYRSEPRTLCLPAGPA
jgi:hypothetical protein